MMRLKRIAGWGAVAGASLAVADCVPGIIGDVAPVFFVAAVLLALREILS
ncbi:hypothetical protein MYSTI_01970 [Myxococcus stipitatus DSM 14675]|uniref:Uncharacterized protein n=1 Tax=Myxococcus stipitatus (strain DSM 14675 / JCM 12634 / Mx s8) TaxID=1278073 RepID=L7UA07_MYXSD|nr:hypothetical protein [Myxococcus stipitatus]AGC43299.1 hypothetical protein MYSTI_01970 [Myxococcus stipitatus DSM 14675]